MTAGLLIKAIVAWFVLVLGAIANGAVRDFVLVERLGNAVALPLSGITLSLLVFVITYFAVPFFGKQARHVFLTIGAIWVVLTLAFEFPFGHYVAGKPWTELLQVFDLAGGNLFVLVLVVSLLSPYAAGRLRHLIA
jgi:hypothetical protein